MPRGRTAFGIGAVIAGLAISSRRAQPADAGARAGPRRRDRQAGSHRPDPLAGQHPSDYSEGEPRQSPRDCGLPRGRAEEARHEVNVLEPTPHYPIGLGRLRGTERAPVLGMMGHYNTVPIGDRARSGPSTRSAPRSATAGFTVWVAADQKGGIAALHGCHAGDAARRRASKGDLMHAYIPAKARKITSFLTVVDKQRAI